MATKQLLARRAELRILAKLPPAISTKLFYIYVIFSLIWRFFTATIWGLFLLSVIAYTLLMTFGSVKPFTPSQLLLWIASLSGAYKVAILSSILTLLGFIIAFHIATINWKQQMHAQLKTFVAGEIEEFFSEASRLIVDAKLYAESIVEAVNNIQNEQASAETTFKVQYILKQTPQFLAVRNRLSTLSVDVHRILGKNYSVLATLWGATKSFQEATKALSEIAESMWIRLPYIYPDDPNILGLFLAQVNVSECLNFISCCERNYGFINFVTGGIRGQLLAPVVGFNLPSLIGLLANRSQFREAIEVFYKTKREGN